MKNQRILITYASRKGSTAEVADEIAVIFRQLGAQVNVRQMQDVYNMIPYDAAVIGSAVYNGALLPEAVEFVQQHQRAFAKLPVAFFTVSMALADPSSEQLEAAGHYLDPLKAVIPEFHGPQAGLFAGSYMPAPWNLLGRLALRFNGAPHGDFRNWEQIRHWAASILPEIEAVG